MKNEFLEDSVYEESEFPFTLEKMSNIDRNNTIYALTHQSTNSGARRDDMRIDPSNSMGIHANSVGKFVHQISHPKKLDEMRDRVRGKKLHLQFDGTYLIHHLFVVIASHFEDGKVVNTCLGLVDCEGRETFEGIDACISEVLARAEIDPCKVVGLSCDRAAANMKYLREVAARKFSGAVHLPCLCHCLNSLLGKASVPNFLEVAQSFCTYYKVSSKFKKRVNTYFNLTRDVPGLVSTRWAYDIPFASWLWSVRGNFREFIASTSLLPSFKHSQHLKNIHEKVNNVPRDWGDVLMEARFVLGLEEIGEMIKLVEGDGIRAIGAFEVISELEDFDQIIYKVKRSCRSDPSSSTLKEDVWRKVGEYLESEIIMEDSKMSKAMAVLDLLRIFNPFWLTIDGTAVDNEVIGLLATHIPQLEHCLPNMLSELSEFRALAGRFVRSHGDVASDSAILLFLKEITSNGRLPGFSFAIHIVAALQCTSAASERAFSRIKKQFGKSRHRSSLAKMEFELMSSINNNQKG